MKSQIGNVIAIIPAFNEEAFIDEIISKTKSFVDLVLVCDDGSTDNTSKMIRMNDAIILRNSKKMGKGYSLLCLFKEAIKYDPQLIITLDADGQHDPNDIPNFFAPILFDKYDFVVGSRFLPGSWTDISRIRNFGLRIINLLHNILLRYPYSDSQCGFRAFGRKGIDVMVHCTEAGYNVESEQLILAMKHGLKMTEIPVKVQYNGLKETSKMNFILHGFLLLKFVFSYYIRNIRNSL